jgi:hypothetical protein
MWIGVRAWEEGHETRRQALLWTGRLRGFEQRNLPPPGAQRTDEGIARTGAGWESQEQTRKTRVDMLATVYIR